MKLPDGITILHDTGKGVLVCMAKDTSIFHEQKLNANAMPEPMFAQLVANLRQDGIVDETPACVLIEEAGEPSIEIISGHHRIRGAREAGAEVLFTLRANLTRSEIASRQLSRNRIRGTIDTALEREIARLIDQADHLLAAYLDPSTLDALPKLPSSPKLDIAPQIDWRVLVLAFLPETLRDLKELLVHVETGADLALLLPRKQYEEASTTLRNYARIKETANAGTALSLMVQAARKEIGLVNEQEAEPEMPGRWVRLSEILGNAHVPAEVAEVITRALDVMQAHGHIGPKNRWQALEWLAANYLAEEGGS